jgi:hypothetical protein
MPRKSYVESLGKALEATKDPAGGSTTTAVRVRVRIPEILSPTMLTMIRMGVKWRYVRLFNMDLGNALTRRSY